jgi:hypothetical protein
VAAFLYSRASK